MKNFHFKLNLMLITILSIGKCFSNDLSAENRMSIENIGEVQEILSPDDVNTFLENLTSEEKELFDNGINSIYIAASGLQESEEFKKFTELLKSKGLALEFLLNLIRLDQIQKN
jgi:hypothetical protein